MSSPGWETEHLVGPGVIFMKCCAAILALVVTRWWGPCSPQIGASISKKPSAVQLRSSRLFVAPRDDRRDDSAAFTASTPDGEIKNLQILSRLSARHHTWTTVGVTQLGVCCLVIICGNHTVVLLAHMGSTCRQRAGPETDGAPNVTQHQRIANKRWTRRHVHVSRMHDVCGEACLASSLVTAKLTSYYSSACVLLPGFLGFFSTSLPLPPSC